MSMKKIELSSSLELPATHHLSLYPYHSADSCNICHEKKQDTPFTYLSWMIPWLSWRPIRYLCSECVKVYDVLQVRLVDMATNNYFLCKSNWTKNNNDISNLMVARTNGDLHKAQFVHDQWYNDAQIFSLNRNMVDDKYELAIWVEDKQTSDYKLVKIMDMQKLNPSLPPLSVLQFPEGVTMQHIQRWFCKSLTNANPDETALRRKILLRLEFLARYFQ